MAKRKRKRKKTRAGDAPAADATEGAAETAAGDDAEGEGAEGADAEGADAEGADAEGAGASEAPDPASGSAPSPARAPEGEPEGVKPVGDPVEASAQPAAQESSTTAPKDAAKPGKEAEGLSNPFLRGIAEEFRSPGAVVVILGLIAALAYFYSFSVPFLFDDAPVVTRNPALWPSDEGGIFKLYEPKTRTLTYITFAINFRLAHGGLVPGEPYGPGDWWSYHLVSILFHALNAGLLFLSIRGILLSCRDEVPRGLAHWVAFAGAAIWTLHPANTMAVAYIAQRFSLVSASLFLGSLLCYVSFRRRVQDGEDRHDDYSVFDEPRTLLLLAGAVVLGGLTGLAKENATVIVLFLLALELIVYRGKRWYIPAAIVGLGGFGLLILISQGWVVLPDKSPTATSRMDYFLTQIPVTLKYLQLQLLPTDLTVEQQFPIVWHAGSGFIENTGSPWYQGAKAVVSLAALGHGLILALGLKLLLRGQRFIPLAIAGFYICNIVESSFIPILDPMVDHRMYLPSFLLGAALCVAVARGLPKLREHLPEAREAAALAAILVCLLLGAGTVARIHTWADPLRIWQDTIDKRPWCARAYSSLGMEYLYKGQWTLAIEPIETALKLGPYHVEGWNNLGKAYLELDRLEPARYVLERGIQVNQQVPSPAVKFCLNNLGLVHLRLAEQKPEGEARRVHYQTASALLQQAVQADPLYDVAYMNLSQAEFNLMRMSRGDDAERQRAARVCAFALQRGAKVLEMKGGGRRLSPVMQRWLVLALGESGQFEASFQLAEQLAAAAGTSAEGNAYKMGLVQDLGEVLLAAYRAKSASAPALTPKILPSLEQLYAAKTGAPGEFALTLGLVYAQMGRVQDGLRLLDEGIQKRPGDPRIKLARAEVERLQVEARRAGPGLGPR